jgi:ELWxxDGT repeat protein
MTDDGVHGFEVWRSDGTASGTTLVKNVYTEVEAYNPYGLTRVESALFFAKYQNATKTEL